LSIGVSDKCVGRESAGCEDGSVSTPRVPPVGLGWRLDELGNAGEENLDAAHVARYDGKEDADAAAEVALLRGLGLGSGSRLVEFGCGTGQFTLEAAAVCDAVVAVDVSPVMLRALTAKLSERNVTNVDAELAGFLTYEHEGDPADFVYSRFALHHLPDFWKAVALERIRRMTRTGGVLRLWDVVYSFDLGDTETALESWCASVGDEIEGKWSRAELEEHVRDEHSTFSWLLEAMLEQSGFAIDDVSYSGEGIFARYVARAV
jgi:ubiquinone/menaquinone biosynthesis C-methylase UbiE